MENDTHTSAGELAIRISKGDKQAEDMFVALFRRRLSYVLYRRCGDSGLAEDLCHEALLIVLARLREGSIEDPSRIAGFLHRTAIKLWSNDARKQFRRQTDVDSDAVAKAVVTTDMVGEVSKSQVRIAVRRLINELPTQRDRDILRGVYIEDRTKADICEQLQLNDRHFDRVLHRARTRFKKLLVESNAMQFVESD